MFGRLGALFGRLGATSLKRHSGGIPSGSDSYPGTLIGGI